MAFLAEADQLKSVTRATRVTNSDRFESSAEHSWHVALYALTLAEHAPEGCDAGRVIEMLILHDLVEIDAGDAPVFGEHDQDALARAERDAAERLFGLLPDDQARRFRAIWNEFEAAETPEALFAKSIDRFVTPNINMAQGGGTWVDYDVAWPTFRTRVASRIARGAPSLWRWLEPRARAVFRRLGQDG